MILIKSNQSVFDLVTQYLGDVKAALDFCVVNDISTTQNLDDINTALFPTTTYQDKKIVEYLTAQNIEFATGQEDQTAEPLGIGTMIIESDFDVL